jgi:UDPglucose 6-dehydrogenase
MIAETAETSKIVVEKSTVPVKAAESVTTILRTNHKKGVKYQVMMDKSFSLMKVNKI